MDTAVAQTILAQLGGKRFMAMTGARQMVGSADSVSFTLPGTPGSVKEGINVVRITLTPMDTYTVQFLRVRHGACHIMATLEDLYADQLQDAFTRETGLATHL